MVAMQYGGGNKKSDAGGVVLDTIWTNGAPENSFAGQTVTLSNPASGYSLLMIVYEFSTSTQDVNTRTYPVSLLKDGMTCTLQINAGSANRTGARNFSLASDTAVTFGAASYNGSTANDHAVPLQIFGIK